MAKGLPYSTARRQAQSSTAAGSSAVSTIDVVQSASVSVQKTVLTLTDTEITLTDNAGVVAYGGLKVYDFPAGHVLFLGAMADLTMTKSSAGVNADWDGDFSLGTVTATNNATLSSTEASFIPSTATPQASSGATTAKGASTSTEAGTVFDGSATATDVYLNFLVDDADHDVTGTACNLIANGTITLHWINLGDN
jgi:hypothetical protein